MPVDPFVLDVAQLRRRPGTRWHRIVRGRFDSEDCFGPSEQSASVVPARAEASCDAVLEAFAGGVMVRATVTAPWAGVCSRCTAAVGGALEVSVRERFVDRPARGGELDDVDAYPIAQDQLDLRPMVTEAIILELPRAPLCRSDCRGLCPSCGSDLNSEVCGCTQPLDSRWAILSVLRTGSTSA